MNIVYAEIFVATIIKKDFVGEKILYALGKEQLR